MHRTIVTLHEYRMRYPDSAAIPTLAQSGFLGLLLDRQRYKAAKLARRRARWRSIYTAPRNACVGIWKALTSLRTAPPLTTPASRLEAKLNPFS
jgi:hypothetical protein